MKTILNISAVLIVCLSYKVFAQQSGEDIHLYMPDGQLKNLPVRVYVTHDINSEMVPELRLSRFIDSTESEPDINKPIWPFEVAPDQRWIQDIDGQQVSKSGTLLLFDLRNYPIAYYKPMSRVIPALRWEEKNGKFIEMRSTVSQEGVYLGNMTGAIGWTVVLVGGLLGIIAAGTLKLKKKIWFLFVGTNGKISLSKVQVSLWTIAIGSLVAMFGFIRLEIPLIPESLLALMGLSLATSGISYAKSIEKGYSKQKEYDGKLSDLISEWNPHTEEIALSIPRAQMLFWTGIMLALFVSKSIIDGLLWEVPWEMVTLMGMSQAGYLGSKYVKPKSDAKANQAQRETEGKKKDGQGTTGG